ncbi:hypothetical protein ABZ667_02310, partial [Streptomyces lavendulae]
MRRYALTTALELPLSTALHTTGLPAELSGAAVHAVLTERFEDAAAVTETYRIRIRAGAVQESAGHTAGATERIVVLGGVSLCPSSRTWCLVCVWLVWSGGEGDGGGSG